MWCYVILSWFMWYCVVFMWYYVLFLVLCCISGTMLNSCDTMWYCVVFLVSCCIYVVLCGIMWLFCGSILYLRGVTHFCVWRCICSTMLYLCGVKWRYVVFSCSYVVLYCIYVAWLVFVCDVTHMRVWDDPLVCVSWLLCEYDDSFVCVRRD